MTTVLPSSADSPQAATALGDVWTLTAAHRRFDCEHEQATRAEVARRLAALQGFAFRGEHDAAQPPRGLVYFAPSDTLSASEAQPLGIRSSMDLFGGVVPHAFVATKVITHTLVDACTAAPEGWNPAFAPRVGRAVLPGFSVFSREDAWRAGRRLLAEQGAVRIKPAGEAGGRGQSLVTDVQGLARCLGAMRDEEIDAGGLVLEGNLANALTYCVGQVSVGGLVASYHGMQRLTIDNEGNAAYGGSDLSFARGDFDALLALEMPAETRLAIWQARLYHQAVIDCYPGFFASRVNYDVVQGRSPAGDWRSGVLEQSWRIGGATGAEIAALERFHAQPECQRVRASCFEVYGTGEPPPDAIIYYRGVDRQMGPLTKFTLTEAYGDATLAN